MLPPSSASVGMVYLVGAGPGAVDLITLRGVECLRRADVVLYDYLVNPLLLAHAQLGAEKICLGKHGRERIWTQAEINRQLVEFAKAGKTVVRLKSGDPAIFGRAAEEGEVLSAAGIPFEMVPGVTAGLAASSYAGIPLTHREFSSAVALVTGHEDADKKISSLDFSALANFPGTLVFYMGVTTVDRWSSSLLSAGKSPETPVAIVRRCSFPDQQVFSSTLGKVASDFPKERLRPPVIFLVGEACRWEPTLGWFAKRPLFGQKILVTRALSQSLDLAGPLAELGAEVLFQPAIEVLPTPGGGELDQAILQQLSRSSPFDWIVFSSANGVRYFLERLRAFGSDWRALAGAKLAAVGTATAAELQRFHLQPDLVPPEFRAESLAAEMIEKEKISEKNILLVRANRGRDILAETLQSAGAVVRQVVTYESRDVTTVEPEIAELLATGKIHWVTVTSSAIARSLFNLLGDGLKQTRIASISPLTSATLQELGLKVTVEAREYTMSGLVAAIQEYSAKQAKTH